MKKLILLSVLFVLNCSEKSVQPSNGNYSISDFPNTEGTQWIYSYYDSLNSKADTVTVTVLAALNQGDTSIWQYSFSTYTDSQYVITRDDTIIMRPVNSYKWPETILVFPLQSGNGWKGSSITDTFTVINQETIIVPAGEFENSWFIEENWGAFNDYGRIKIWFEPKVGVIKKHHLGWSFGLANNTWKLLSYTIKE